jgi:hypothetical protein
VPLKYAALIAFFCCSCSNGSNGLRPLCNGDSECGSGQLCFAEGCADPGKNVVAEITTGTSAGQWPTDIAIEDGELGPGQDFKLLDSLFVKGTFEQQNSTNPQSIDRVAYLRPVVVRAVGASTLIPGLARSFKQEFDRPERGYFEMRVGDGTFTFTATPADVTVPPVVLSAVRLSDRSQTPAFPITFAAVEGSINLPGRILKKIDVTVVPNVAEPVTAARLDIQAFSSSREAISQRFPVSTLGDFNITLSPSALKLKEVLFVVSPRSSDDVAPVRELSVPTPLPTSLDLEFGDFGSPQEVSGLMLDSQGAPVVGAQVVVEGLLRQGATFRSGFAITDAKGRFSLRVLVTSAISQLSLTAVPPSQAMAAALRIPVEVTAKGQTLELRPNTIVCKNRIGVQGRAELNPGQGADTTLVRASYQAKENSTSLLALDDVATTSDRDGNFALHLDEGIWRLELSRNNAPLTTRLIEVKGRDSQGLSINEQLISPIVLAKGVRVSGFVRSAAAIVAEARVRFFRVTSVDGKPSAILLGSAIADPTGKYEVLLPTK